MRVLKQDYHRNGVGGAGFVVSLVEWPEATDGRPDIGTPHFVAVSFFGDDETDREAFIAQTAVLSIDLLFAGIIDMHHPGGGNAWRGSDKLGPLVADAWQAHCRAGRFGGSAFDPWEKS